MLEGVKRAREAHGARLARDGEMGMKRKAGRSCVWTGETEMGIWGAGAPVLGEAREGWCRERESVRAARGLQDAARRRRKGGAGAGGPMGPGMGPGMGPMGPGGMNPLLAQGMADPAAERVKVLEAQVIPLRLPR